MKSPVRLAALGATLLLLAGCGGTVDGKATSSLWDPNRVAGLPVTDGASGIRSNAPEPTGTVQNTDGGQIDKLALLSINDIEEYWSLHYSPGLNGTFKPVDRLVSFDPHEHGPDVCGESSYHQVNAMYCNGDRSISWDRSVLLPTAAKFFGDLAVTGVLAHEYGHAIQRMAGLVSKKSTTLVLEQQADCFAGDYMRWVAEGSSSRFELSTGDGLNAASGAVVGTRVTSVLLKFAASVRSKRPAAAVVHGRLATISTPSVSVSTPLMKKRPPPIPMKPRLVR